MHSAIIVGSVDRNVDIVVQNTIDVSASKYDYVYISEGFNISHSHTNVVTVRGQGDIEYRIRACSACGLIQLDPLKSWFDVIVLPCHGLLTKVEVIKLLEYACCKNIISVNNALDFDLNPRLSDCLLPN